MSVLTVPVIIAVYALVCVLASRAHLSRFVTNPLKIAELIRSDEKSATPDYGDGQQLALATSAHRAISHWDGHSHTKPGDE